METMSSSSSLSVPHEPSNFDEASMHQTLLFSDSLKELKNLRTQLYSAAEYFELSYANDDQKQMVVDTLKDYAVRALVNTVDHLGSVTYKVNDMLDERVNEVSGAELRVSCIEQRLRTCQNYTDHEGLAQQSLMIATPKHHKRYILPAGETLRGAGRIQHQCCSLDDEDHWLHFKNAVRSTISDTPPPSIRNGNSPAPSPQQAMRPGTFSFQEKRTISEKRTVSPIRARIPLIRSGSLSSRPTTPVSSRPCSPSRPTTPSSPSARHRNSTESWKSVSMRLPDDRESQREIERPPSKSKRLLKALLSRRKSKKDEALYTFLDEY